ncbi:MAG: AAA family ATPase [Bryobacterales bacterium]|nr:AAA family ATPase [Bryobacterales bacterium]
MQVQSRERTGGVLELAKWALDPSPSVLSMGLETPRALLLSGPPGCGKSRLARKIAEQCGAAFLLRRGADLLDRFHQGGIAALALAFDEARRGAPSILYIDDIDLLAPRDTFEQGRTEGALLAHLLAEIDSLAPEGRILLIGATARPNSLAAELRRRGRLDREVVVPVPDRATRREILETRVRALPVEGEVDFEHLARATSGLTGADLDAICQEAVLLAMRRGGEPPKVRGEDFLAALGMVDGTADSEIFLETPATRWTHIGGMEPAKQRLRELVEWPLRHAELYACSGLAQAVGVLLSGPQGSGKTLLARAVASESGAGFLALRGRLFHSLHTNPIATLHEAFRLASQAAPCILFLDDVDELLAGGLTQHFLAEMSARANLRGVAVLAATSFIQRLDSSVLAAGALEEIIDLPLPDEKEREEILALHLRRMPNLGLAELGQVARLSGGLSGADLGSLCERATRAAIHRAIEGGEARIVQVGERDLQIALDEIRSRHRRHFT